MEYAEFAPIPALAAVIEKVWTLSGDAATLESSDHPVLPDGRPELVLHLGDAFTRISDAGQTERQAFGLIAGQLTSALTLRPMGRIRVLGLRLRPYGAAALDLGPADRLLDCTIDAGAASAPIARLFQNVRDTTDDLPTAAALMQHGLLPLVDVTHIDARVRLAADAVLRRRGRVNIDRLAESVEWSRRSLERAFQTAIGVAPKRLARIARFQHALRVIDDPAAPHSGAFTAAICGYADQAHFVRDFRELAGCPPGAHLLRRAELMQFFLR